MTIPTHQDESPLPEPDNPLPVWKPNHPSALRACDPDNPTRNDTHSAAQVFLVMIGTLFIGAVLNAEAMAERASAQELGRTRDLSLAVWEPLEAVAQTLQLTTPRRVLENIITHDQPEPRFSDNISDLASGPGVESTPIGSDPSDDILAPSATNQATTSLLPADATRPTTNNPADASPGRAPSTTLTTVPNQDPADNRLQPTPESPLRLLIVGDSTMDGVGAALLRDATATGKIEAQLNYKISTGLSRPDFYDWPQYLRQTTSEFGIGAVIIMLGANDAQPFLVNDEPVSYGTDLWFETYTARVAGLMAYLAGEGVRVVWVGQAPMKDPEFDAKMVVLNEVYRTEAERAGPLVEYLDPRGHMGDEGSYASYLPNQAGEQVRVRRIDGVHFTPEGGDRLSPFIIQGLGRLVNLDPQP